MSARSSRISWHRCHLAGPASAYRAHRRCFCHLDSVSFLPHPFTGLFPIDDLSASFTVLLLRMRRKKRHVAYLALLHAVWQYRCFIIRPDCIPDKVVQFPVRRQDIIHEIVTVDCTVTDRLVSWIDHMAWPVGLQAFSPVIICAFIPCEVLDPFFYLIISHAASIHPDGQQIAQQGKGISPSDLYPPWS